jgi:hypothetical protein
MTDRTCEYCDKPLSPDARTDQRFCGPTHRKKAKRVAKAEADRAAARVDALPQLSSLREEGYDGERQDAEPVHESDRRFAAIINGEDPDTRAPRRRGIPTALWERIRETLSRNPGVLPAEAVQARTDAARATERAKLERLRSTDPALRVQDRHDPSTRASVGLRGSQMRKLNTHNMPRPPVWAIDDAADEYESLRRMQPGETSDSPFYRSSRPQGGRSRHAAYRWAGLDDGFRF